MPTYDYECRECGHRFEAFQTMSEEPLETCPECSRSTLRRLIGGGGGIIFKGSGFYINDSRKSNGNAATGAKNGSAASSGGDGSSTTDGSAGKSGSGDSGAGESGTKSESKPAETRSA